MQLDLQVPGLGWDLGSVFLTGFLGNAHTHMVRGPRGHVVKMSVGGCTGHGPPCGQPAESGAVMLVGTRR